VETVSYALAEQKQCSLQLALEKAVFSVPKVIIASAALLIHVLKALTSQAKASQSAWDAQAASTAPLKGQ